MTTRRVGKEREQDHKGWVDQQVDTDELDTRGVVGQGEGQQTDGYGWPVAGADSEQGVSTNGIARGSGSCSAARARAWLAVWAHALVHLGQADVVVVDRARAVGIQIHCADLQQSSVGGVAEWAVGPGPAATMNSMVSDDCGIQEDSIVVELTPIIVEMDDDLDLDPLVVNDRGVGGFSAAGIRFDVTGGCAELNLYGPLVGGAVLAHHNEIRVAGGARWDVLVGRVFPGAGSVAGVLMDEIGSGDDVD